MNRPLEVTACIILGLIALSCIGGLVAAFALKSTPDPSILVTFSGLAGTSVGAIAGIVTVQGKGNV